MSNITGTLFVQTLTAAAFTPPAGCVSDNSVQANAKVSASKLQHRFQPVYSQTLTATASADRKAVHVVHGLTGTVNSFSVGSKVANIGDSTVTVNLYKNGTTILSAPVVLDNTNTAYIVEDATVSSPTLAVNDVLEISVAISAGTGTLAVGVFAVLQLDEDAN